MAKPIRVYWDACAWIAYINQEKAVLNKQDQAENRFSMCRNVLKLASKGKIEIVTSAFTLAEVCKKPEVKESGLDHLPSFFEKSYILVIPVDLAIGRKAQTLQVSGLVNLKPPDAVHIASAQRANVTELHTFDAGVLNLDGAITNAEGSPMKICKPTQGQSLGPLFEN